MMRPGTFERVYAAIKDQLRHGFFRPGQRLEPAILSTELNASVTPVRDALHRLTGERLVEAPRHEGFRVPFLTESTLRHLYAWHRDLLLMAIASHRSLDPQLGSSAQAEMETPSERQNVMFLKLARSTGNPEYALALESLLERLEPFQRFEAEFLDALEQETAEILAALKIGDRPRLRSALLRYHKRRARIIPELLGRHQTS